MRSRLNSNVLKFIAILAMTIDHLTDLIFPNYQITAVSTILHIIGRITAPIMWFFICEGFFYTKNIKKYIMRLFIFSIISHFAYCFAFGINFVPFVNKQFFNQTSVMWGLGWSAVMLYIWYKNTTLKQWQKYSILFLVLAITFPSNWSCVSVMAILYMYPERNNFNKEFKMLFIWSLIYGIVSFIFYSKFYGLITIGIILVYPILKLYNHERGKAKWMKWFFYIYYPLHLIIIGVLRIIMYGNIPLLS